MPPKLLLAGLRATTRVLFCTVALTLPGLAQLGSPALSATRERLEALKPCVPAGDVYLSMLGEGLLGGYGGGGASGAYGGYGSRPSRPTFSPPPPPPDYLVSLDRDIAACDAAYKIKDKAQRAEMLKPIAEDIRIKAEDCRKFGMGRRVSVRVSTLQGGAADNGWEVFYKWAGSSGFETAEVRVPQLTSPATVDLPPGAYIFRAQKKVAETARATSPVRIVVGGAGKAVECELPIQ